VDRARRGAGAAAEMSDVHRGLYRSGDWIGHLDLGCGVFAVGGRNHLFRMVAIYCRTIYMAVCHSRIVASSAISPHPFNFSTFKNCPNFPPSAIRHLNGSCRGGMMKIFLVVMMMFGGLYYCAPGGFRAQKQMAKLEVAQAGLELHNAMLAVAGTNEQSPDFEKAMLRTRKAAAHAMLAEKQYGKYLAAEILEF
jgi:hypothetical protein